MNILPSFKNDIDTQHDNLNLSKRNKIFTKKKRFISTQFKKKKHISYININSHFIIDLKNPLQYFIILNNKNLIKFKSTEYIFLKQTIQDLSLKINSGSIDKNFVEIPKNICQDINNYFKVNTKKNKIEQFIEKKLIENKSRNSFSCRKLANSFFEETGERVSKTYINNILKNNFKLSYLKTPIKTHLINNDVGIFSAFYFIKSIIKCMSLGFKLLFLDESSILSINNNYRAWRSKNDELYFTLGTKKKKNLLLIVSDNSVIHYKITDSNTDENIFLTFMKEVISIISKKINQKFVIVMDNLSSHRTKNAMDFYINNKLNIIFNCVYRSSFNCVELAFKSIKLHLYKNLYESIDETINDVKKIIEGKNFKSVLVHNYLETLYRYLDFYEKNKNINLNILNI